MHYLFRGRLCGYICKECREALSNVTVRLYRLRKDQAETALATAHPKDTFKVLDEEQFKAKQDYLIAEARTDADGNFQFELGDEQDYGGGAFEVDVLLTSVPGAPGQDEQRVQFTVTTLQPQWRQREDGLLWGWEYCLPYRLWCYIRGLFGAWVICGQVTDCKTGAPVGGVKVIAFDRDWLQDDELGAAFTDASGHFRIDYTAADFRPGTFIDIELIGGPDVYFRVESAAGTPLLTEPPSRGRDPDRENVGPCFCVKLCLEETPPDEEIEPLPFFSHVGVYPYATAIDSTPGATGRTLGSNRAFYATLRLNGVLSKTLNGNPMEYRFEVQEIDSAGTPISGWAPVSAGQIAKTKIGILERANPAFPATSPNPIETLDYVIGTPGPNELAANVVTDVQGDWVQVPQESSSPLGPVGFFTPNHDLIRLNSTTIAPFPTVDLTAPTPVQTGDSTTSTGKPLVQNKHFAIRMRVREVGQVGPGNVAGICQNLAVENTKYTTLHHPDWMAQTLTRIAVAMVDIDQLVGSGCTEIASDLDVLFTAAHPNLGSVSLSMSGPGGPYSFTLPAAVPGERFGTATPNFVVADLQPCAYIVTLSVQVLLTTGDSVPDNIQDQIAFCKA